MNADDICAELAAARSYITRGDYTAALEAIDQCVKLWSAERDYWALIEADNEKAARLEAELVRMTTASENARIRAFQHNQQVRWVGRDGT